MGTCCSIATVGVTKDCDGYRLQLLFGAASAGLVSDSITQPPSEKSDPDAPDCWRYARRESL